MHPFNSKLLSIAALLFSALNASALSVDGLSKRQVFTNSQDTFYEPGLGACGIVSTAADFIVALDSQQFGPESPDSPQCFRNITITYQGKSAQAQIVDDCPLCSPFGLDLSPALFEFLAGSLSVGLIETTWSFND